MTKADVSVARANPALEHAVDSAVSPLTPDEGGLPSVSAFTTELPPEARMMLDGVGTDAVLNQTLANQDNMQAPHNWFDPSMLFDDSSAFPRTTPMDQIDPGFVPEFYGVDAEEPMAKCVMPNNDEDWRSFLNEAAWGPEQ